jgi:hypothetical protein
MKHNRLILAIFILLGTVGMSLLGYIMIQVYPGVDSTSWTKYNGTLIGIIVFVRYHAITVAQVTLAKTLPLFRDLTPQLQRADAYRISKFFAGFFYLPFYVTILVDIFKMSPLEFQMKFTAIIAIVIFTGMVDELMEVLCLGKYELFVNIHHWIEMLFVLLMREWIDSSWKKGAVQFQAVLIGINILHKFIHFAFPLEHISRFVNISPVEKHVLPPVFFSPKLLRFVFKFIFFFHLVICSIIILSTWTIYINQHSDDIQIGWKILGFLVVPLFWIIDIEGIRYFVAMGFGKLLMELRGKVESQANHKLTEVATKAGTVEQNFDF